MNALTSAVRRKVFASAGTLIVKIGSNVLARDDDQLDVERIESLSKQVDRLRSTGRKVILVSSGAIAAGIGILGLPGRPGSLSELQAAAAVGQSRLMTAWGSALGESGHRVAQILVTLNDFRNRKRYLNVRNTIRTLLDLGVVPVVNENDTVSVEEITLGDNDQLASMVATLVPDPLVIILSGVDGLMDGPPESSGSQVISLVEKPSDDLQQFAVKTTSTRGTGGMSAKLRAIVGACGMGESVILANGRTPDILDAIQNGDEVGTLFLASGEAVAAWKKWIGFTGQPEGLLVLDAGACRAVRRDGRSLLAVGIRRVEGNFEKGASVGLADEEGHVFGRGLANYSADEVRRIAGAQSDRLPELLGHVPYDEVVHRDNLVVTSNTGVTPDDAA